MACYRGAKPKSGPGIHSRFILIELKPGQLVWIDNKGYPVATSGGWKYATVAVDVKTGFKVKVDLRTKTASAMLRGRSLSSSGLTRKRTNASSWGTTVEA